jgi:1-acyl-sn-glycerol-3-phosphate acyltransferase
MSDLEPWYAATIAIGRVALRGLTVTTRVSGAEHLPRTGPVLLACAHASYPDFLFVGRAGLDRGRRVRFMCRHDIWHVPVVARAMSGMRHIPVDRTAPAAAYLDARRLLREGEAVCAFPEAGISFSYTVRPLMRGVAALARETGVPVVPVVVWGGQRMYSVGRPVLGRGPRPDLTRGRLVDVRFGEPFGVGSDADLVETTRHLGHTLTELLESVQLLPEHRPGPTDYAPWYPAHLGGHAPDRTEALTYDELPSSAVLPTWGPGPMSRH